MPKYYFLDRSILQPQRISNAVLKVEPIQKDVAHNPLFGEDFFNDPPRLWEVRYDNSYPNVIYDAKEKIYRCYYTLCTKDIDSASADRTERASRNYRPSPTRIVSLAYAESTDGVHWVKPELGLVEFNGSKANNLLFRYAHGTGVFLDEQEIDPKRRYKLVTKIDYPGATPYMAVNFSPDGIHWGQMIAWPRENPPADSHNFPFRDKTDGLFKVITRTWRDGMRICSICSSQDFINWSAPKEILVSEGFEDQIYSMPVFWSDGIYLGLASIFHEGDRTDTNFDLVDCELTYARQSGNFNRVAAKQYAIPRGQGSYPNGAYDCGCIYASAPVEQGEKLWVYYMGGNGPHTNFRETSLARGYWNKDRYAAYLPKQSNQKAVLWTIPLNFIENDLEILAQLQQDGSLEVALVEQNGTPLAGYDFKDCKLTQQKDGYSKVTFAGGSLLNLENRCASVILRFEKAKLYAMRGGVVPHRVRGFNPG